MKTVWPHEIFKADFDVLLDDAKRQEEINPENLGEFQIALKMHDYFVENALPLISNNDSIFAITQTFTDEYAIECFRFLRMTGPETFKTQMRFRELKQNVIKYIKKAKMMDALLITEQVALPKTSDFYHLLDTDKLTQEMHQEALELREEITEQEMLYLLFTLDGMRGVYENVLPRIMFVIRPIIKVLSGEVPKEKDKNLYGISQSLSWYQNRFSEDHPFYPVLGELSSFYKVARNVASHHTKLRFIPESDQIILPEESRELTIGMTAFQQKYRYLIYFCEFGLRGILGTFCEREKGTISNKLVRDYDKTFPDGFPQQDEAKVILYPSS